MRTTVEIKPEHRSALLALAARRGGKGFSAVLEEAIEGFLRTQGDRQRRTCAKRRAHYERVGCDPLPILMCSSTTWRARSRPRHRYGGKWTALGAF
jgi:hypothetical protein